jgi:hypothetical protein
MNSSWVLTLDDLDLVGIVVNEAAHGQAKGLVRARLQHRNGRRQKNCVIAAAVAVAAELSVLGA